MTTYRFPLRPAQAARLAAQIDAERPRCPATPEALSAFVSGDRMPSVPMADAGGWIPLGDLQSSAVVAQPGQRFVARCDGSRLHWSGIAGGAYTAGQFAAVSATHVWLGPIYNIRNVRA